VSKADISSLDVREDEPQPVKTGKAGKGQNRRGRKSRLASLIFSVLVYALTIAVVISVYMYASQNSGPRVLLGYSMYFVLTSSMESVIPQGSLVLAKQTDPNAIRVGDDVTYIRSDQNLVTHRVVDIYEDYLQSGMRGFQTKGTENPEPDSAIVYADNIIGKVIFHSLWMGLFLSWLKARILLALGLIVIFVALIVMLRYLARSGGKPAKPREEPPPADVSLPETSSDEVDPDWVPSDWASSDWVPSDLAPSNSVPSNLAPSNEEKTSPEKLPETAQEAAHLETNPPAASDFSAPDFSNFSDQTRQSRQAQTAPDNTSDKTSDKTYLEQAVPPEDPPRDGFAGRGKQGKNNRNRRK